LLTKGKIIIKQTKKERKEQTYKQTEDMIPRLAIYVQLIDDMINSLGSLDQRQPP